MSFEGDAGAVTEPQGDQGQGGGAEGAPVSGQQQQGTQGSGDPIARLVANMETFQQTVGQQLEGFASRLPAAPAAEGGESEGFDIAALLEELPDDAFGEDGAITPEGNLELIRQVARAEADAVRNEHQQAALDAANDSYANELEQKYDELKDPAVQRKTLDAASQLAQQMGAPQMASNARFFEQVYLAMKAQERAAGEVPAGSGERGVRLEQPGGGGGPIDGNNDGPSEQQRIVDATRSQRFRLGSQG